MALLADQVDAVLGVDTHRDTHQVELTAPTGAVLARVQISNDSDGFARLICWMSEHAPGPRVVAAVEGTRSYGIGVTRALTDAGLLVLEAEQPARKDRRGRGKSDPIDAHLAALFALSRDTSKLPTPRADGTREALRILLAARQETVTTSTGQINRLRALLLAGDDRDRAAARAAFTDAALAGLSRRHAPTSGDPLAHIRHGEIRRLAIAVRAAIGEMKNNRRQLRELVDQIAPGLTDRIGVGPVSAAQVIVSFSHPGRVRNEAAFAALAGTSPIQASSGHTVRHRLNRGGDRALNRAVHTIALTRMRSCPRARAYIQRRTAEGKSSREIRRAIKRYITRELYRSLNTAMASTNT
jgi:transposase